MKALFSECIDQGEGPYAEGPLEIGGGHTPLLLSCCTTLLATCSSPRGSRGGASLVTRYSLRPRARAPSRLCTAEAEGRPREASKLPFSCPFLSGFPRCASLLGVSHLVAFMVALPLPLRKTKICFFSIRILCFVHELLNFGSHVSFLFSLQPTPGRVLYL